MGKASKWFRAVLGLNKPLPPPRPSSNPTTSTSTRSEDKPRRWSFGKSKRVVSFAQHSVPAPDYVTTPYEEDPNNHAIAVATATAAERAAAATHAAAEVVRLTSSGRCAADNLPAACTGGGWSPESAAVKIQSAFRGFLARRALRALRALVRLQALVRGHIERKRTAEWLRRMQALLRAQARARAGRVQVSEPSLSNSNSKPFHLHRAGPPTPDKFEHPIRTKSRKYDQSFMFKRTGSKSNGRAIGDQDKTQSSFSYAEHQIDERSWDQRVPSRRTGAMEEEKSDKILEIDTGKHRSTPKREKLFHPAHHSLASDQSSHSYSTSKDTITHQTVPSPSSGEVQSLSPLKFSNGVEEAFCTAENSPQFFSASSRGGSSKRSPFTPTKSDGSRSFLSDYSDYPNYMTNTESSRAKVRSLSAPKQRPQYERSSS